MTIPPGHRCEGVLVGPFVKDKANGSGVLNFANGDIYRGDFFNGERHGRGVLTFADGSEYNGFFLADYRSGKGRVNTKDKPDVWGAGMWYRDKLRPGAIEGLSEADAEEIILSEGSARFQEAAAAARN